MLCVDEVVYREADLSPQDQSMVTELVRLHWGRLAPDEVRRRAEELLGVPLDRLMFPSFARRLRDKGEDVPRYAARKRHTYRRWTTSDIELLVANLGTVPVPKLAAMLGRSTGAVHSWASKHGYSLLEAPAPQPEASESVSTSPKS